MALIPQTEVLRLRLSHYPERPFPILSRPKCSRSFASLFCSDLTLAKLGFLTYLPAKAPVPAVEEKGDWDAEEDYHGWEKDEGDDDVVVWVHGGE